MYYFVFNYYSDFCLLLTSSGIRKKDYLLSFENEQSREDWMQAILDAKSKIVRPDSVKNVYVAKYRDNMVIPSKGYFENLYTSLLSAESIFVFEDYLLCLASFLNRANFLVRFP